MARRFFALRLGMYLKYFRNIKRCNYIFIRKGRAKKTYNIFISLENAIFDNTQVAFFLVSGSLLFNLKYFVYSNITST